MYSRSTFVDSLLTFEPMARWRRIELAAGQKIFRLRLKSGTPLSSFSPQPALKINCLSCVSSAQSLANPIVCRLKLDFVCSFVIFLSSLIEQTEYTKKSRRIKSRREIARNQNCSNDCCSFFFLSDWVTNDSFPSWTSASAAVNMSSCH